MNEKLTFIVWSKHSRRAETLAAELDGHVSFHYEGWLKGRWLTPLRYLVQAWKTWRLLERERPRAVLVQVPPIFALLTVSAWCELRGQKTLSGPRVLYVADCHTGTFYDRRWRWALPLLRLLSRRAAVTLVASEAALSILQLWRVRSLFLIDGLPDLSPSCGTIGSIGEQRVAVISGFGTDEPVAEVFTAARLLPHVTFYFSGDLQRLSSKVLVQKPVNVILTGFLQESEYVALLKNVHGLVDLTNEPNILTCGAYEALAVGKPAVVSNWPQVKRYFSRGFVYVDNTPETIASGVKKMLNEETMLTNEVLIMRSELVASRQTVVEKLTVLLQ